MTETRTQRYFRPDEIARLLSVNRKTVYRWIAIGYLKAFRIGGVLRVPQSELRRVQKKMSSIVHNCPTV